VAHDNSEKDIAEGPADKERREAPVPRVSVQTSRVAGGQKKSRERKVFREGKKKRGTGSPEVQLELRN